MGLSDLAEGVTVTAEQRDRGVVAVDRTGGPLDERLASCEADLPVDGDTAARILERYAGGGSVGQAAAAGRVPRVTAAKTLHLVGESVSPLGPTGRTVLRDWIAGDLSRSEALRLSGASPEEFALAAYVETHEPVDAATAAVRGSIDAGAYASEADETLQAAGETPEALR